jgi:hypothetical protein
MKCGCHKLDGEKRRLTSLSETSGIDQPGNRAVWRCLDFPPSLLATMTPKSTTSLSALSTNVPLHDSGDPISLADLLDLCLG